MLSLSLSLPVRFLATLYDSYWSIDFASGVRSLAISWAHVVPSTVHMSTRTDSEL